MSKKIGIITYHGADNYGSVLQAYSLKKTIENLSGQQCDVINYISDKQKEMYSIFHKNTNLKNILKNIFVCLYKYKLRNNRKEAFNVFRKKYLGIKNSDFNYISNDFTKSYSAIICGSDQIWNLRINDFSDYYFISFVHDIKKVAYAASMGGIDPQLSETEKKEIRSLLSEFSQISVRETIAQNALKDCTEMPVELLIDPVFLLSRQEWSCIASGRIVKEKYIFFYSIDYNDDSVEMAKWYSNKYKMPVVVLFTSWKSYFIECKQIKWSKQQSPKDFLSLVKHAEFILSGSFHGVAFSLIFNKPFYRIQKKINGIYVDDDRIMTLFNKLHVNDRQITIDDYIEKSHDIYKVDYKFINSAISTESSKSKEFLKNI